MEKPEDRSTTDPGGKTGTTDGGERPEQTASFTTVENPSLNLRTSKLPINIGVPYSPNKKIGKKAATDTADNTPRPTNKPDNFAEDEAEMFVDLSPLDSARQLVRDPAGRQERHPMAFTPSSFSLGIDRSQDEPVVQDPMPVAFAFPAGTAPMMAQPMADGRKAVKFAEPIVQGTFFVCLSFCFRHFFSLLFFTRFFWFLTGDGKSHLMHMATGVAAPCHLQFVAMLQFHSPSTWQLESLQHGKFSSMYLANGIATWQHL